MKRQRVIALLLLFGLLLAACGTLATDKPTAATEPAFLTEELQALPETEEAATQTQTVTEPAHSPLYIPGVGVEDVILYFNEVCLDAETVNGGDPSVLQKWMIPIRYVVHGSPTAEDRAIMDHFTQWLNALEGFPGISETKDPMEANLRIHFCDQEEMSTIMGDWVYGLDGAVTFWYEYDEIYDAVICCRTDLDQYLRNSVIQEEIYNGLGPVQDTSLRPDSIIYAEFSQPQSLTPVDELLLKLLYHPDMVCGMNAEQCEAVIRQLYY